MTTDRIREIHKETAYPESVSVFQALLQVWNECEQDHNKVVMETAIKYAFFVGQYYANIHNPIVKDDVLYEKFKNQKP